MKKRITKLVASVLLLISIVSVGVSASSATSYTYSMDANGYVIRTQDAYLPDRTITTLKLNKPEDIFIDEEDNLYIADTLNKRILKYDIAKDKVVMEITNEEMKSANGIFVTNNGDIYVADQSAGAVHHFAKDGTYIEKFGRPTAPAFGMNDFNPMKVAVDETGNMYVLGEGIYDGIIQLAHTGEFLGYFTSNKVNLTFVQRLQDLVFTEAQKANLLGRSPVTFTNVYVDDKSIVYTTSAGSKIPDPVKKHNTAGANMIKHDMVDINDMLDVTTDKNGVIYAASKTGLIFVYTNDGEFIYVFGAYSGTEDVSGLFSSLAAIAVDSTGKIWTIDNDKSFVQSFVPTDYATEIYSALSAFNAGQYEKSIEIWNDILKLNQMSILAHGNIGKNYLFKQKYEEAMYHTKIAGNRFYYSQAYWEVRNIWLQDNLSFILIGLVVLFLLTRLLRFIDKKRHIFAYPKRIKKRILAIKPLDDTLYAFKFFRHPIDSFYYLKLEQKGSLFGAIFIYFTFFVIFIWSLVGKGFIYQYISPEDVDIQSYTFGFFAITLLFVFCNYLVSSINDGEGNFKQIFKMLAYALTPMLIAILFNTIASHFLTYNETFMLDFVDLAGKVWTGTLILIGVQETHSYDFKNAVKSILLSVLFILIVAVVLLIVIIMGEQLYQFFEAIIKEVIRNATR